VVAPHPLPHGVRDRLVSLGVSVSRVSPSRARQPSPSLRLCVTSGRGKTCRLLYKMRNSETILVTKVTDPLCPRHLRLIPFSPSHFPPRFHFPLSTGNSAFPLPRGEGKGEGQTGSHSCPHPDEPGRFPIPSGVRPRGTQRLTTQPSRSSGCHRLIGSVRVNLCPFVVFAPSHLCLCVETSASAAPDDFQFRPDSNNVVSGTYDDGSCGRPDGSFQNRSLTF
jgi:hypothetical protein